MNIQNKPLIQAGEIPALVAFFTNKIEQLRVKGQTEGIKLLEDRVNMLMVILDGYMVNTGMAVIPGLSQTNALTFLGMNKSTQLTLPYHEAVQVEDAKTIAVAVENAATSKEVETAVIATDTCRINLAHAVLYKWIENNPDWKDVDKNIALHAMWISTCPEDPKKRIDYFSQVRFITLQMMKNSSISTAYNRLKSLLPEWKKEEILGFIEGTRVAYAEAADIETFVDPTSGAKLNQNYGKNPLFLREVKILMRNREAALNAIEDKKKREKALKQMTAECGKEASQMLKTMSLYKGDPYVEKGYLKQE